MSEDQLSLKDSKLVAPKYEPSITEGDFVCPSLREAGDPHPYVDRVYCESFSFGKGCRQKRNCVQYQRWGVRNGK